MSTAVDLDLLADYVGGALEGTPDEQRVAELIAVEPAWARAHAELAAADTGIRGWLAAAPAAGPMPDHVAARIDAALLAADSPAPVAPGRRRATGTGPAGRHPIDRSDHRRPGARRRWLSAVGAIAAAVLGIALFGQFLPNMGGVRSSNNSGAVGGEAAPQFNGDAGAKQSTGTNYTPATLPTSGVVRDMASAGGGFPLTEGSTPPGVPGAKTPTSLASQSGSVPDALSGLTNPSGLAACYTALRAVTTPPPGGALHLYDFAFFEGRPAAIIQLVIGERISQVYVVGPQCGQPDADLIYAVAGG